MPTIVYSSFAEAEREILDYMLAITASSGHITITVVWPQTKPSADIHLAITMWPKLVDHYTINSTSAQIQKLKILVFNCKILIFSIIFTFRWIASSCENALSVSALL